MSPARRLVAGLIVLLLFFPASATLSTAQWNIHLVQRLRHLKRISPDAGLDRSFRKLLPFLPTHGDIGFQNVGPPDESRLFYRAQYALAPRQLVRSPMLEFVVESGPADAVASLSRDPLFGLVTSVHDELRLFRRIQ